MADAYLKVLRQSWAGKSREELEFLKKKSLRKRRENRKRFPEDTYPKLREFFEDLARQELQALKELGL